MQGRIQKGIGSVLAEDNNAGGESLRAAVNNNAEYGNDPVLDDAIESQYIDPTDELKESYIDKVGRETGITADVQNIDTKIIASYRMLEGPSDDIFNNPNLADEEKVALYDGRRDVALNRIGNLQKLQQGKIKEINDLAESEATKEREKQAAYKSAMELNDSLRQTQEFELDKSKTEADIALNKGKFKLDVIESSVDIKERQAQLKLDREKFNLDKSKFGLEEDKFAGTEVANSPLVIGDFSSLGVGGKYNKWTTTQTYGTKSVLGVDNVKLVNGEVGTPGVDFAGQDGDTISAFAGGEVIKVVNGEGNYGVGPGKKVGYGNQVVIKDVNGNIHYYNHLKQGAVEVDQKIQRGQTLGYMGNSGSSTGTHLDYRVASQKGWEDPRTYLNKTDPKAAAAEATEIDVSTVDKYLEAKKNTKGGNILGKINEDQANNIIQDDMGGFKLSTSELNDISTKFGIESSPIVVKYNLEKFSQKQIGDKSGNDLYSTMEKMLRTTSDQNKNTEGVLTALIYSGKIDDDIFNPGFFNDAKGWDLLQEYFPDISEERIKEIKGNLSTAGLFE